MGGDFGSAKEDELHFIRVSFRSEAEADRAAKSMPEMRSPFFKDRFDGKELSAENIRRTHATYEVPIGKLHSPDFVIEPDMKFVSLFKEFLLGRVNAYLTRIPAAEIMDGFCTDAPECKEIFEETAERDIAFSCASIRAGERPSIWIRENETCGAAPRFFHTDGIAVLKAYRRLGFAEIPVIILAQSPPKGLPNSAYVLGHGGALRDPAARVEDFVSCEIESIAALADIGTPLEEILEITKLRLRRSIERLTAFHCDTNEIDIVHYHDSVFSVLVRAEEHILAIESLIENELWSPIPNLQRSLYELCLSYYVDWLAPHQVYFDLSVSAQLDYKGQQLLEESLTRDYSKKYSTQKAKAIAKRALKLVRWLEKVSNKARFAPVGIALHDKFYSGLSSTAHQDFSQTARHANRFRKPAFAYFDERHRKSLADFLNIVVGNIVVMAEGDMSTEDICDNSGVMTQGETLGREN